MSHENFAAKDPRELVNQALGNSRYIQELTGQPLIPPSVEDPSSLGSLSQLVVEQRFGRKRFEILTEVMRAELAGRDVPEERQWEMGRWLKILNGVDGYIAHHHSSEEDRVLYPKQIEVFEALGEFLQNGGTEGYFKLPTAFGKTVVFTEFVKAANLRTLIVVPTIEILDQTEDTFAKLAPDLEVGKVYAHAKDFLGQITVTTYESLIRMVDPQKEDPDAFDFLPEDFDLLVLDEAHHALGQRASWAVSQFSNAIKLGFTATPVYSESRQVGKLLKTQIYGMSIKEAVEEELLSPFKVWLALTNTDLSNVDIDSSTGDYNQAQLARVVNTTSRNQGAVELYQQHFNDEAGVVYCVSVRHAQDIARLFREKGVKAEAIWGSMNQKRRASLVEAFRKGEIDVLCNMQLLTEGFDAPNASVCINLRPTLSGVVAEQRGGRVLRNDPANPNKEATIVDFMDREKSDRQQVTFAEVAETAGIPRKLEGQIGAVVSEPTENGRYSTSREAQTSTMGGLKVVTEITEIMRVASEARTSRLEILPAPEGFLPLSYGELISEYRIGVSVVEKVLRGLIQAYPDDFIRKIGRSPTLVNGEGLTLLREELEKKRVPEGYTGVPIGKLADTYGVSVATVQRNLKDAVQSHPDEFLQRNRRDRILASQNGLTLLGNALNELKLPEGFLLVNLTELGAEYRVPNSAATKMVQALSIEYPDDIRYRGGNNRIFATEDGLARLRNILTERQETRVRFTPLDIEEIAKSAGQGITPRMVRRWLYKVAPQNPDHFPMNSAKKGKGGSYLVSAEGLEILQEQLRTMATPEGYARVNLQQIGKEYGMDSTVVYWRVMTLWREHPDYIIRRGLGKPIDITAAGMEALRTDLDSRKDLTRIPFAEMVQGIDLNPEYVRHRFRALMQSHPEHFLRGGASSLATKAGLELLQAEKEGLTIPEGYSKFEMGDLAEEYGVSRSTITQHIDRVREISPQEFIRRGERSPYYVTEGAMGLLKKGLDELLVPEGFNVVRASDLTEEFSVSVNTVYRYIERLHAEHPSDIIRQGKNRPVIATELGISLLRGALTK